MPIADVFILCGIILSFFAFGAALAWGEYQTRSLPRAAPERGSAEPIDDLKKAA